MANTAFVAFSRCHRSVQTEDVPNCTLLLALQFGPSSDVSRSMTEQDELSLLISHRDGGAVISCQLNRNPKVTGISVVRMRLVQA
jgi:hypothetical protein